MQLRWTEDATADLERIADYLFEHVPDRAADLVFMVYEAPTALLTSLGMLSSRIISVVTSSPYRRIARLIRASAMNCAT